ncbi:hypothetical protein BAOM_1745 [Peribacillus asahii]|uniref:Uncharacterized protein n=1 Tax=Peribacillus asahii TaxID=228899 RepID=A0A3T0KQ11_9BACI|nr:hypothetical protein BAOM_1745 [Peribacillus asahii]
MKISIAFGNHSCYGVNSLLPTITSSVMMTITITAVTTAYSTTKIILVNESSYAKYIISVSVSISVSIAITITITITAVTTAYSTTKIILVNESSYAKYIISIFISVSISSSMVVTIVVTMSVTPAEKITKTHTSQLLKILYFVCCTPYHMQGWTKCMGSRLFWDKMDKTPNKARFREVCGFLFLHVYTKCELLCLIDKSFILG